MRDWATRWRDRSPGDHLTDVEIVRAFIRQPAGLSARQRAERVALMIVGPNALEHVAPWQREYRYTYRAGQAQHRDQIERHARHVLELAGQFVDRVSTWEAFSSGRDRFSGGAGGAGWRPLSERQLDDLLGPPRDPPRDPFSWEWDGEVRTASIRRISRALMSGPGTSSRTETPGQSYIGASTTTAADATREGEGEVE